MLQDDEEAHLNKQQLRREFLQIMQKPFEEALECYKEFVLKVVYATWFDEKVAQMLDQVENFRHVGSILCSHNKNRTVVF